MPTSIRLFVDADLAKGAIVDAAPGQAHYLGSVMRRAVGDEIVLFNGREGEWTARIEALRKDRGRFVAMAQTRPQTSEPEVWLAFAPLKHAQTDLVVQKATELGVTRIIPVLTERTNASRLNLARLGAIALEAAEQCERLSVPEVTPSVGLRALLAAWPDGRPLFAAVERAAAPFLRPAAPPFALLIGPEGGFTGAELDALAAHAFVRPASLGPRILRAETAAIVGLALLQA